MTTTTARAPRIALLCATRRGLRFLEKLIQLAPASDLLVMSFHEDPDEPRFLDDIRRTALAHDATFVEGKSVADARHRGLWEEPLDLLFAVNWRYMVPRAIYPLPRRGSFVIHDSLLPEYRGFAPTVWAIVNGETATGATLFEMADAVDAGAIVDQRRVPITPHDTIGTVSERVTDAYLSLLEVNLPALLAGTAPRRSQDESAATYTCRRLASDGVIDWCAPSRRIYDLVRGVTKPYWGARTTLDSRALRIWETRLLPDGASYVGRVPGRVVDVRTGVGAVVLTGDSTLLVTKVQAEGDIVCATDIITSLSQTLGR